MEARKQVVNVKVVRGAKIGSNHYLVLMKVKLRSQVRTKNSDRWVSQQIRIDRLKDDEVRGNTIHPAVEWKCEEARAKGYMSGEEVG